MHVYFVCKTFPGNYIHVFDVAKEYCIIPQTNAISRYTVSAQNVTT